MIDLKKQDWEARILAKRYVITVLVLLLIGLIFIYSASSVHALESKGNAAYFVKKQFFAILLGLFAGILMLILPRNFVKKLIPVFFLGAG